MRSNSLAQLYLQKMRK